jgi:hypothetical protein
METTIKVKPYSQDPQVSLTERLCRKNCRWYLIGRAPDWVRALIECTKMESHGGLYWE